MGKILSLETQSLPSDCYVFKHSTACPISGAAAEQVRAGDWERPLYWINVIEQRSISNWVEENYGVLHESPQLLSIRDGKVVSVLNHRAIVNSAFQEFRKK